MAAITHIPLGIELALRFIVIGIALLSAYCLVRGLWPDREDPQEPEPDEFVDAWAPLEDAAKRYENRIKVNVKPMSVHDWLSKEQY